MATALTALARNDVDDDFDLGTLEPALRSAAAYVLQPGIGYPVLSSAVAEVMTLANSTGANFREVDRVVRQDPVVAARVLSVANSPLYRPPGPITSLRAAMMRLGWGVLREILLQAIAEAHLFRHGPRRELANARVHAIVLAHVHRHVAQVVGFDTEHAFACGLLHDLGHPLMLGLLSRPDAPRLDPIQRAALIDVLHCTIGERVARRWALPDVVVRVCREHHDADEDASTSGIGVSTIAICEALVAEVGLASEPQPTPESCGPQLARLGLPAHELESLRSTVGVLCREAM
jgi:putative nucleotidyltransferase with HDIG domain